MDRPHVRDQVPEFPSAPDSLSHRQLAALLRQAPKEAAGPGGPGGQRLQGLLQQHERLSQAILEELAAQGEALQGTYTPPQLMALGALAAHLRLSLQALDASRH